MSSYSSSCNTNIPTSSSYYMDNKPTKPNFLEPTVVASDGHMVMTGVYKPTRLKYFNIDTRFCDATPSTFDISNNTEFVFGLPERITSVKSIKVKSVEIPLTFHNISSELGNDTFYVYASNAPTTPIQISIAPGYYEDATSIQAALNNALETANIASSEMTFTIDSTGRCAIQNHTNTIFTVNWYDKSFMGVSYHIKQTLGYMLGFRKAAYELLPSAQTSAETWINLHNIRYLYLVVDEMGSGGSVPNSFLAMLPNSTLNRKVLARISLNSTLYSYGFVLWANETTMLVSDKRTYSEKVNLHRFKVQLVNEWGSPVSLLGFDYSFVIEMECE